MTPKSTIDLSLLLSLFTIIFVGLTYYRSSKRDTSNDVKEQMKMSVKLDTICNTTNETRSDIKSINKQLTDLMETQILQGQELKTMWRKVDEHSEKLSEHEVKIINLEKENIKNEEN